VKKNMGTWRVEKITGGEGGGDGVVRQTVEPVECDIKNAKEAKTVIDAQPEGVYRIIVDKGTFQKQEIRSSKVVRVEE